jgi:hypothetical protein
MVVEQRERKHMKVATVNVIEVVDDSVIGVKSYKDNEKGNKQAEKRFIAVAKENGCTDEEMDACLEDGYYSNGNYYVSITHSS